MTSPIDIVSGIISLMRDSATIVSITDLTGGYYSVKTNKLNDLASGDYVTISGTTNFNGTYEISSISSVNRTFRIAKTAGLGSESGTYTANKPYFLYGHLIDIINQLAIKDKSAADRYKKYPVILLPLDITENIDGTSIQGDCTISLIIANVTKPEYISTERKTVNFDAILYPLYNKFLKALNQYPDVIGVSLQDFPHTKIDRYFWGRESVSGNKQNILNDYVDAIEIRELNLKIKPTVINCN